MKNAVLILAAIYIVGVGIGLGVGGKFTQALNWPLTMLIRFGVLPRPATVGNLDPGRDDHVGLDTTNGLPPGSMN